MQTWKHHNPEFEIKLVNDSNIRDYIPDMPEEYFRLLHPAPRSDFFRAGVIYHHGGVYMDTDFMAMKPLTPMLAKLDEGYDIVTYGTRVGAPRGPLHGGGRSTGWSQIFLY